MYGIYSLEDFYIIFAQADTDQERIDLLKEWSSLPIIKYNVNWDRLIYAWSNPHLRVDFGEKIRKYS